VNRNVYANVVRALAESQEAQRKLAAALDESKAARAKPWPLHQPATFKFPPKETP
jgi:hypothetical protein